MLLQSKRRWRVRRKQGAQVLKLVIEQCVLINLIRIAQPTHLVLYFVLQILNDGFEVLFLLLGTLSLN